MGGSASTSKSLAVAPLVEAVKSGGDEDKQKAARIVADFADSDQNVEQIVDAGGVAPLLQLLDLSKSSLCAQSHAAVALRKVASVEKSRARLDDKAFVAAHAEALATPPDAKVSPSAETRGELARGLGQLALKKSIVAALPVVIRAGQESEIPNFKGSDLGHFPLVSANSWTSDHLLERPRSVDAFSRNARARNTHVEATLNHSFAAQAVIGVLSLPDGEQGVALAKQYAVAAIFSSIMLHTSAKAKQATLEAGGLPGLVAVARSGSDAARRDARTCLTQLAETPAHREAIVAEAARAKLDLGFLRRVEILKS